MNKDEYHMNYYWYEDFGAVEMYLKNGSTMWFILPDEDKTVDDVLDDDAYMTMITEEHPWDEDAEHYRYMKVNLSVPQFDVSSSADLKEALQNMGVTDIFDPACADFSPSIVSTPDKPPYITAVNQDVRVKIDEKGVTAAAYIEIPGAGAAAPPEEVIDFVLDRPFVFAVTKSQIPLFVGTVNDPTDAG
jgi:serpin B